MTTIWLKSDERLLHLEQLESLKREAIRSPDRRARYCLHALHTDGVQEMVIALCRNSQVPIHRHINRSESFHMIEGELEVLFYNDQAEEVERVHLGEPKTGLPFCFREDNNRWHTVRPLTELVIFHEIAEGPFQARGTQFLTG